MNRTSGPGRLIGTDEPLAFIEAAANPIKQPPTGTEEEKQEQTLVQVRNGFVARAKEEAHRFQETTRTDYYVVMVFEHGDQVNAFLRQSGYPDANAMFVDGTIVAEKLGMKLPPTPFRLKPLRKTDNSLSRMVTALRRTDR